MHIHCHDPLFPFWTTVVFQGFTQTGTVSDSTSPESLRIAVWITILSNIIIFIIVVILWLLE